MNWSLTWLRDALWFLLGFISTVFALFIKSGSHGVIDDYVWCWGDFFLLSDKGLFFDGIFTKVFCALWTLGGGALLYGWCLAHCNAVCTLSYWLLFEHLAQLPFLQLVCLLSIWRKCNVLPQGTE
ncbi:phosphatidylethanolamine N-methyltransferase [Trypanosoma cruzi]|nr:phosphatidylethanolamine N-methyltransferase [Trypanosoma cruzi]